MDETHQKASAIAYKLRGVYMQIDFKPVLLVVTTGLVGGCSGFESVPPPEGDDEYVFACAKAAGQSECEARAAAACPDGFETLSSEENFERKELRIRCSEVADSAR